MKKHHTDNVKSMAQRRTVILIYICFFTRKY